tara:strand:- start:1971 stop:2096 length:126 start_codon:yes stop_codon:yes gene_type:complete
MSVTTSVSIRHTIGEKTMASRGGKKKKDKKKKSMRGGRRRK